MIHGRRRLDFRPVPSATSLQGIVLPIPPRPDFPVAFEGYARLTLHWRPRCISRNGSLKPDILRTSRLLASGVEPVTD